MQGKSNKYRRLPAVLTPIMAADIIVECDSSHELRKHDLIRLYQAMEGSESFSVLYEIPKPKLWGVVLDKAFVILSGKDDGI